MVRSGADLEASLIEGPAGTAHCLRFSSPTVSPKPAIEQFAVDSGRNRYIALPAIWSLIAPVARNLAPSDEDASQLNDEDERYGDRFTDDTTNHRGTGPGFSSFAPNLSPYRSGPLDCVEPVPLSVRSIELNLSPC
jgi:hypothetical protein